MGMKSLKRNQPEIVSRLGKFIKAIFFFNRRLWKVCVDLESASRRTLQRPGIVLTPPQGEPRPTESWGQTGSFGERGMALTVWHSNIIFGMAAGEKIYYPPTPPRGCGSGYLASPVSSCAECASHWGNWETLRWSDDRTVSSVRQVQRPENFFFFYSMHTDVFNVLITELPKYVSPLSQPAAKERKIKACMR